MNDLKWLNKFTEIHVDSFMTAKLVKMKVL